MLWTSLGPSRILRAGTKIHEITVKSIERSQLLRQIAG
jgi:hypothetical protein